MTEQPNRSMQWTVLAISGTILVVSVVVNIFNPEFDAKPAYYLFTTVSGLVFGASVIKKLIK